MFFNVNWDSEYTNLSDVSVVARLQSPSNFYSYSPVGYSALVEVVTMDKNEFAGGGEGGKMGGL